jgi:hypothetical protein
MLKKSIWKRVAEIVVGNGVRVGEPVRLPVVVDVDEEVIEEVAVRVGG